MLRFALSVCLLAQLGGAVLTADERVDADLLLEGGTLFDGSGGDGTVGDVAIRNDRIVAVGKFAAGNVRQRIDCRGLIVAPGFIDLHNHSDRQVIDPATRGNVNFLLQGCTTIVTGNCGSGPVDVADYYGKIDAAGAGTHVAHLLPQGSLRDKVLGTDERRPTTEELDQMRQLARQAMEDGAWGMSSGLIYVPSAYADTSELAEIARVVAEAGGLYASHIRGEGTELLASIEEALEIGRRSGAAVHISHFKASNPEAWGLIRQAAALIEKARAAGERVTADQYPYAASSTSLEAMLIPTWARAGGSAALLKRLDDPALLQRISDHTSAELKRRGDVAPLKIARYDPRPAWVGLSLQEIAAAEQKPMLDIVLEITRHGGAGVVSFGMHEDDVRYAMQLPWVATASDGRAYIPDPDRPHPRSYGTFPRKIGRYAIEMNVVPLAEAIRSASGLPAEILGLTDRGFLKLGLVADVVAFDPEQFRDRATYEEPHKYATGVKYVYVAGQPAVFEGVPTGALAGRALRKQAGKK